MGNSAPRFWLKISETHAGNPRDKARSDKEVLSEHKRAFLGARSYFNPPTKHAVQRLIHFNETSSLTFPESIIEYMYSEFQ